MNNYILHKTPSSSFLVDPSDFISASIIANGYWELELEDLYTKIIKDDFVVIDAGANIGYHTVKFAKLAKTVHAFEPVRNTYYTLCGNIAINNLSDKVITYPLGLGNYNGFATIEGSEKLDLWMWGGFHVTKNIGSNTLSPSSEGDISISKLDNFNLKPDLIKIDVEGFEPMVIDGGMETISKHLPIILIEIHKNENQQSTIDKLLNLGYRVHNLGIKDWYADYICVHSESKHYQSIADIIWS
jgi:FkbM family methyltransferase